MRILHLASGNRWTGAAAPAFAEVDALRLAGADAHYAYVGGYKLEAKLQDCEFAHPVIEKAQNPASFLRSVRKLAGLGPFDVVHSHLTWDHVLALRLGTLLSARVARTFHAERVLRSDPFARALIRRTPLLFAINASFALNGRSLVFTPPPLDHRQFSPDGPDVRQAYGLGTTTPVVAVIGKLAPGRGFELAIATLAAIRKVIHDARLLIIGHGPHRPVLERLARELAVADAIVWAGYHEEDLAEHYRAADAFLFTARGSDEGHRAVLEAMACGVPPVSAPIAGVDALLGRFAGRLIAGEASPEALAAATFPMLAARDSALRQTLSEESRAFGYPAAAGRLSHAYSG